MKSICGRLLLLLCLPLVWFGCNNLPAVQGDEASGLLAGRQAYRQQLAHPATRSQALLAGLHSPDPLIRRHAMAETLAEKGLDGIPAVEHLTKDQDPVVQSFLIEYVRTIGDPKLRGRLAREIGAHSKDEKVQKAVNQMISTFDFYRANKRLRDDPTWDHEIETLQAIEIPDDNWKILADPTENCHEKKVFAVDFDDRSWKPIKVGGWEGQGMPNYDGVAWYRIRFQAPAKGAANAAELHFGAVDEVAWVWLNGIYVSQHDLGPHGWDIPFALDITPEIKWGEENLLVVRVYDSAQQGGIWKPVKLHVLK